MASKTANLAESTKDVASQTGALAESTKAVANKTAELAEATERVVWLTEMDVSLSRTAIEAAIRPVLITVPRGEFMHPREGASWQVRMPGQHDVVFQNPDRARVWVTEQQGWLFVSVPVRNEGAGTAFGLVATLDWQDRPILGEVTSEQVPRHEFSRASFGIPPGGQPTFEAVANAKSVSVRVSYIDLAGNVWQTALTLAPHQGALDDWRVTEFGGITHQGRVDRVER